MKKIKPQPAQNRVHDKVQLEGVVKRQKKMKQVRRVKGHVVRVGQHRLPQVDIRIPQRKLPPCVRVDHYLMEWIMKIQNVPKVEVFGRKQGIPKERDSSDHEQHRIPEIRIRPPASSPGGFRCVSRSPPLLAPSPGRQEIPISGACAPRRVALHYPASPSRRLRRRGCRKRATTPNNSARLVTVRPA